jgi:hypothetical protein
MTDTTRVAVAATIAAAIGAVACQAPRPPNEPTAAELNTETCGDRGSACCSQSRCNTGLECVSGSCTGTYRPDFIATVTSSSLTIGDGTSTAHPTVAVGDIVLRNEDNGCLPSSSKACHFTLESVYLLLNTFDLGEDHFSGVTIQNANRVPITAQPTGSIPSGTSFYVTGDVLENDIEDSYTQTVNIVSGSKLSIDPSGSGGLHLEGTLQKSIGGRTLSATFSIQAPLLNRPPVVNAGPDITVSGAACEEPPFFDGSETQDVDGNIASYSWYEDRVLVGFDKEQNFLLPHRGLNVFTLKVTDTAGAEAVDTVRVTANCPNLPPAP